MTKPTNQEEGASGVSLFEELPQPSEAQRAQHAQAELARKRSEGTVRLLQPNRLQVELRKIPIHAPEYAPGMGWLSKPFVGR